MLTTAARLGGSLVLPTTNIGNAMEDDTLNTRETIVAAQPNYQSSLPKEDRTEAFRTPPMQDVRMPSRQRIKEPYVQTA
jgi:hypothetical protein